MTTMFKYFGLAAAIAVAPIAASAVTVTAGDLADGPVGQAKILAGEEGATISFTTMDAITVNEFLVSGVGKSGGSDLEKVTFNFMTMMGEEFETIISNGGLAQGFTFIDGPFNFAAGETFVFDFFGNGNTSDVGLQVTFDATTTPVVPLPAGGLLLLSALGAGVVASRRKKA